MPKQTRLKNLKKKEKPAINPESQVGIVTESTSRASCPRRRRGVVAATRWCGIDSADRRSESRLGALPRRRTRRREGRADRRCYRSRTPPRLCAEGSGRLGGAGAQGAWCTSDRWFRRTLPHVPAAHR